MLYIRAYDENVRTKRRHPSKEGSPTMMMSTLFPAMRLILRADVRPLSARGLARRRRRFFFFWRETEREFSSLRLCRRLALLQRRDGVLLFFLSFPSPVGGICARACAHGRDDPAAKNGDGAPPEAVEGRQSSHFVSETHFSTSRVVVPLLLSRFIYVQKTRLNFFLSSQRREFGGEKSAAEKRLKLETVFVASLDISFC